MSSVHFDESKAFRPIDARAWLGRLGPYFNAKVGDVSHRITWSALYRGPAPDDTARREIQGELNHLEAYVAETDEAGVTFTLLTDPREHSTHSPSSSPLRAPEDLRDILTQRDPTTPPQAPDPPAVATATPLLSYEDMSGILDPKKWEAYVRASMPKEERGKRPLGKVGACWYDMLRWGIALRARAFDPRVVLPPVLAGAYWHAGCYQCDGDSCVVCVQKAHAKGKDGFDASPNMVTVEYDIGKHEQLCKPHSKPLHRELKAKALAVKKGLVALATLTNAERTWLDMFPTYYASAAKVIEDEADCKRRGVTYTPKKRKRADAAGSDDDSNPAKKSRKK